MACGKVPEDISARLVSPGWDIHQGGRLAQSRCHQQAEHLAVGELELRIWGQMAVDDAGDVELIEQRLDQRQGTQIDDFLSARGTMPDQRHGCSLSGGCGSYGTPARKCTQSRTLFYAAGQREQKGLTRALADWELRIIRAGSD
jgi:hypothetical protein